MSTGESSDENNKNNNSEEDFDLFEVVVIGAGAAGIGAAIALAHAGVEDFLLVERDFVGSSFASWPKETRFITPSFPSNSIGMLDLNSISGKEDAESAEETTDKEMSDKAAQK